MPLIMGRSMPLIANASGLSPGLLLDDEGLRSGCFEAGGSEGVDGC